MADEKREAFEQEVRATAGNAGWRDQLQRVIPQYPEKPIPARTVWQVEQKLSTGLPMTVRTTCGVKSLADGKATIVMQSAVQSDTDADEGASSPRKFDLKGTEGGVIVVDQATGWIVSGGLKRSLSGTLLMEGGALAARVPAKLQSELTFGTPDKAAPPGVGSVAPSVP